MFKIEFTPMITTSNPVPYPRFLASGSCWRISFFGQTLEAFEGLPCLLSGSTHANNW